MVYNEKLKKRILTMSNIVGLFGSASHVLKITEQRKQEIALAATEWTKGVCRLYFDYSEYHKDFVGPVRPKIEYIRGYVYMITLTNSHNASHSLEFQREGQKKAMKRFFEGRTSTALMQRLGKRYHVTNYEVTLGQNGWHPHHHILVFSDKNLMMISSSCVMTWLVTGLTVVKNRVCLCLAWNMVWIWFTAKLLNKLFLNTCVSGVLSMR